MAAATSMRIEQLEYAVAVARHGSFRRAAEELHISQPALSTAIRNLERELGAVLFDRGRGGARVSPVGADLLPRVTSVVAAYDGLRRAADDRHRDGTIVRIGTVNAGTVPIVTPTAAAFQRSHPSVRLEVVSAREAEIDQGLHEGRFDLGLITCLAGDDMPPDLETVPLVRGRVVVCLRVDSPLAERDAVTIEELAAEPQILMRPGFLMHRVVHRLLDGRSPAASYLTDGGDMGKLMVAEGVGVMVVPDFSIIGDPLEVAGLVTWRPLTGVDHEVQLAVRRRQSDTHPRAVRELRRMLLERAATYETAAAAADAA